MAIIGIDLGTTNSLVSVWKDGKSILVPNSFGEYLTPSVVGLDDDGSLIIGRIAKERLISHPDVTISSFKCFMGTDMMIDLGEDSYTPSEVSSFVLRKLKEDAEIFLGEKVEEAVISVPAYFDDNGRNATKLAGELAGLKVERIINEPSAAALAYKVDTDNEDTYLVFDFGGGTLDISVVDIFDSIIEIIAVAGDNHLGGDDFNLTIAKHFCVENHLDFNELPLEVKAIIIKQAEQCKIALSTQESAGMIINLNDESYSLVLDNQKLLQITAPLFERLEKPIIKAMRSAQVMPDDISEVILVGGSSHMLLVKKFLENLFRRSIRISISPDTAVAIGVGIAAGIKERKEDVKDMILTDICPFTLGTNVFNSDDPNRPIFKPMIDHNTTLPASYESTFYTIADNQTSLCFRIAQGEKLYFDQNLYLGEIEVSVPPAAEGEQSANLRFTYDINGILQVDVFVPSTGEKKSKLILNKNTHLTEEQLASKIAELEKIKIQPRDMEENKLLVARAESLFEENAGPIRDIIRERLHAFDLGINSRNNRRIRQARRSFDAFLTAIENNAVNPFNIFNDEYYDDEDWEDEE